MIPKKLEEKKDKESETKQQNYLIELKVKNILIIILIDQVQQKKTYDLIHTEINIIMLVIYFYPYFSSIIPSKLTKSDAPLTCTDCE